MSTARFCSRLLGLLLLGALPGRAADAPAWLAATVETPVPANAVGAPAVILVNDTRLEMDERGRMTETHRVAMRILNNTGKKHAMGILYYNGASGEVQSLNAWVVRDGKIVESKGKVEWLDLADNSAGAVIDEKRTRSIDLSARTVAGDIMGYETKVRTPLVVGQLFWLFGHRLPQARESISLVLPPGFSVKQEIRGDRALQPAQPAGSTWTWSLAEQPYLPDEAGAPPTAWYPAEVFIRIQSPPAAPAYALHDFGSWLEVAALYEKLNAGQCDSSPPLAAKARELVAKESDVLGRITRLAEYAQRTRYVGVYRGLRYGYGWKARKASEVFATGYGDCKDKANLLMALLREIGIKSHRVIALLDGDRKVRPEFASPIQFDHAIIAIEVPETVTLPAVVPVAGVGRLLFFDPTNPHTTVGDLSPSLQGGYVHVVAPGVGELTRLPEFSPEADFRLERRMDVSIAPDGMLNLKGSVGGAGQVGAMLRGLIEEAGTPVELNKLATGQLAAGLKSAALSEAKGSDDRAAGRASLSFAGQKKGYLQFNPDGTAVMKLDVLSRAHLPNLSAQKRSLPVALDPLAVDDTLEFQLPVGYAVDELPRAAEIRSDYGSFTVDYALEGDRLVLRRHLVFERKQVSVAEYGRLRQFLGDISRADRTAVLIRKMP